MTAEQKEAACNALANYLLERFIEERPNGVRDFIREQVVLGLPTREHIEWLK